MPSRKSILEFWKSLPGILTGIAGLVTATVSLFVLLSDGNEQTTPLENNGIVQSPSAAVMPSPSPLPTRTPLVVFLTVGANPSGGGSVAVVPPPGQDGGYAEGTNILLTAKPSERFRFSAWSGGASGGLNPLSFNINSNMSVTAVFSAMAEPTSPRPTTATSTPTPAPTVVPTPPPALLTSTAQPSEGGTVDVSPLPNQGEGYTPDTIIVLTARPSAGYEFVSWSGSASGTINPLSFTITSITTVVAVFSALPTPTPEPTATPTPVFLGIFAQPIEGGRVDVVPPPNLGAGYAPETNVILTARPNTGFQFSSWAGDASGSINPLSFSLITDLSVTAVFLPLPTPTPIPTATSVPTATAIPTATPIPVPEFDPSPFQFEPQFGSEGDEITLFGSGFDGPDLLVTFGGTPAKIVSVTPTRIVVEVPGGIFGSGKIGVSTNGVPITSDDVFTIF